MVADLVVKLTTQRLHDFVLHLLPWTKQKHLQSWNTSYHEEASALSKSCQQPTGVISAACKAPVRQVCKYGSWEGQHKKHRKKVSPPQVGTHASVSIIHYLYNW